MISSRFFNTCYFCDERIYICDKVIFHKEISYDLKKAFHIAFHRIFPKDICTYILSFASRVDPHFWIHEKCHLMNSEHNEIIPIYKRPIGPRLITWSRPRIISWANVHFDVSKVNIAHNYNILLSEIQQACYENIFATTKF